MLNHDSIWRAIDKLADAYGYSPSGLAKKAGLDPTTFNKSKRMSADGKPRWPSTESIAKILSVTGASLTELIGMIEGEQNNTTSIRPVNIPTITLLQANKSGAFNQSGEPTGPGWEVSSFPVPKREAFDSKIYALKIEGDSFAPKYRNDDILILSPHAVIRSGHHVIAKTTNGRIAAGEWCSGSGKAPALINPAFPDQILHADDMLWTARILWASQ